MSISKVHRDARAMEVLFEKYALCVRLADGREVRAPLEWFPRLRDASPRQRKKWRLVGDGVGIHWSDIDEDISIEGLLRQ